MKAFLVQLRWEFALLPPNWSKVGIMNATLSQHTCYLCFLTSITPAWFQKETLFLSFKAVNKLALFPLAPTRIHYAFQNCLLYKYPWNDSPENSSAFLTKCSEMQEIHGEWSPNNICTPIIALFVLTFLERCLLKSLILFLGFCTVYILVLTIPPGPTLVLYKYSLTWIKQSFSYLCCYISSNHLPPKRKKRRKTEPFKWLYCCSICFQWILCFIYLLSFKSQNDQYANYYFLQFGEE